MTTTCPRCGRTWIRPFECGCFSLSLTRDMWTFKTTRKELDAAEFEVEPVTVNSHGSRVAPDGSISEADLLRELGHHE